MTTHTHTGFRPHTGYRVRGKLFGHQSPKKGRVHALNFVGREYRALCGETVSPRIEDNEGNLYLDRDTKGDWGRHVFPTGEGNAVSCKRCLSVLAKEKVTA